MKLKINDVTREATLLKPTFKIGSLQSSGSKMIDLEQIFSEPLTFLEGKTVFYPQHHKVSRKHESVMIRAQIRAGISPLLRLSAAIATTKTILNFLKIPTSTELLFHTCGFKHRRADEQRSWLRLLGSQRGHSQMLPVLVAPGTAGDAVRRVLLKVILLQVQQQEGKSGKRATEE